MFCTLHFISIVISNCSLIGEIFECRLVIAQPGQVFVVQDGETLQFLEETGMWSIAKREKKYKMRGDFLCFLFYMQLDMLIAEVGAVACFTILLEKMSLLGFVLKTILHFQLPVV